MFPVSVISSVLVKYEALGELFINARLVALSKFARFCDLRVYLHLNLFLVGS
jgi:hypothetical protein